jgi:hypothetical protein
MGDSIEPLPHLAACKQRFHLLRRPAGIAERSRIGYSCTLRCGETLGTVEKCTQMTTAPDADEGGQESFRVVRAATETIAADALHFVDHSLSMPRLLSGSLRWSNCVKIGTRAQAQAATTK